jgi:4-amino-4-deoxy-L-arabinose transferase-like glycosyltransferase
MIDGQAMKKTMNRMFKILPVPLLVILLLSVILRVAGALYLGNDFRVQIGTNDQLSYHALALRLLSGYGFTFAEGWWPLTAPGAQTAHWSFLYTFYVTAVYALFGEYPLAARLIQAIVVGIAQPYLTYLIARRLFTAGPTEGYNHNDRYYRLKQMAPLVAAGLAAIYAYFVYYSATLMTEPFYITSILLLLYLSVRLSDHSAEKNERTGSSFPWKLTLAIGLTMATIVLLRQLFLLFIPFLCLWLLWMGWRQRQLPRMILSLTIALAIVVLSILPFTLYNYARFDRLVLLNTNSGYALYLANHPIYGTNFRGILPREMGTYQDLIPVELRHLDEAALDQALLGEALKIIEADPMRYLLLSISRTRELFKFWPSTESSAASNFFRVFSFGLFLPFMLYGLWRTTANYRSSPYLWLLYLFITFYIGIHLFSWSLIRYRLPVDAVLLVMAAYGIADLAMRVAPASLSGYFLSTGHTSEQTSSPPGNP